MKWFQSINSFVCIEFSYCIEIVYHHYIPFASIHIFIEFGAFPYKYKHTIKQTIASPIKMLNKSFEIRALSLESFESCSINALLTEWKMNEHSSENVCTCVFVRYFYILFAINTAEFTFCFFPLWCTNTQTHTLSLSSWNFNWSNQYSTRMGKSSKCVFYCTTKCTFAKWNFQHEKI